MKLLLSVVTLFISLQATGVVAQGRFGDDRQEAVEHGWMFDYDQARAVARKSNRPLMLVFRCVP